MERKEKRKLIIWEIGKIIDKNCKECEVKDHKYCDFCNFNTQLRSWGEKLESLSGKEQIKVETKRGRKAVPLEIDYETVDKRQKSGELLAKIAEDIGVNYSTLKKYMSVYRTKNKITTSQTYFNELDYEMILERKANGETLKDLAAEIGCHHQTLIRKVNLYKKKNDLAKPNFPVEEVYRRVHVLRQSQEKVAEEYGITAPTLRARLKKYIKEKLKKSV